ncbi:hypothetical protein ACSIGC_13015 [Tenacibaculum sp. ZS6-P6]|uniref:hypothetical protein n=1 Tax=Tenacibaculum sp. ZS6-P6 TaxID=3447503 RepID=UPI003F9D607A
MTAKVLKFGLIMLLGTMIFISCSDEEGVTMNDSVELSTEDIQDVVIADDITSDIDNILEDDDIDFNLLSRSAGSSSSSVADCVTRTVEADTTSETLTITLDFGDNCIGPRGKELSGKIVIVYQKTDTGYSKEVSFDNFSVDGNVIEGSKSVVKVKDNGNGNKEATHTVNISVTLATGETVSLEGTRVREKIAGDDTLTRGDDVYLISGNWKFVNKLGNEFTGNITEKLRREYACKFIVSGVTEITKNGVAYTLDFGDGTCDNIATVTNSSGESREIMLRRR